MMEWMEYWVMPLEWVDRAVWVSKVELMGDLEMDMPKFFFRPTPSWLSPGRLTRSMALQKQ